MALRKSPKKPAPELPRYVEPQPEVKVDEPWEPAPAMPEPALPARVVTPLEAEALLVQSEAQAIINAMGEKEPDRKGAFVTATRLVQSARKLQDMLR